MNEQKKYGLRKFLIVAAIAVGGSSFAVLADAEKAEIYTVAAVEQSEPPVKQKPVYRCPNIILPIAAAAKMSCHQTGKDAAKKTESDRGKIAAKQEIANGD